MAYPGCSQPEMSTPVLCYRLSLAKPGIPFFLLQLLGSSLLMTMPDLLIWNIVFFFWNFWVSALIAEFWPMIIYNRQFYSKVFQKCPCSSKCMHNGLLCPRVLLSLSSRAPARSDYWTGLWGSSLLAFCFQLHWALPTWSSGRWMGLGDGPGEHFHLTTFLYFIGGEAEDNVEGSK